MKNCMERGRAPDGLAEWVRAMTRSGAPLPPRIRHRIERCTGMDCDAVRVHTGPAADRLARLVGADAVTAGADIFFRAGRYRPHTPAGMALLGHEVGHVMAGAAGRPSSAGRGTRTVVDTCADSERHADAVAARVMGNVPARRGSGAAARPLADGEDVVLHRHASWEHRLLGDAPGADLDAIAQRLPNRQTLLEGLRDFLYMWHQNPRSVTEEQIAKHYPYIRTLRLQNSGLLVTYGELNTLPDYLANPTAIDDLDEQTMLPILQAVRQEGYNNVQRLLNGRTTTFEASVGINTGWSIVDLLWETRAIDDLTKNLGPRGTDHYTGLVARNACHFAPYSWYRWQTFYTIARAWALKAYQAPNPATQAEFTRQAWVNAGYADHFLQDSFAAGHLVNKTMVMQWFLEWAKDKWYVPVPEWGDVSAMTTGRQPTISAPQLYDFADPGTVRDPQTAEEQPTLQQRMDMCGVRADGSTSQRASYQKYLAFLNAAVVQSSSGALHDYFNMASVWAGSNAISGPFQLWGDDTMLNGGDGVKIADDTAHLAQSAISDILRTGASDTTVQQIYDQFPTRVANTRSEPLRALKDWNLAQRDLAFNEFPDVHYFVLKFYPRIGNISIDQ